MRADSHLQGDVEKELKWWASVDAAHIGVAADNGIVTLSGQVTHYAEKATAERAALGVYGVKGIANEIVVEPKGASRRSDQDIAEVVLNHLSWNSEVPKDKVTVVVTDGWVKLAGKVDWQYERAAAMRNVNYLHGVKGVTNSITVKPTAKWSDVTSKIEDSFRRNATLDARRIGVQTHDGKVTLSGSVSSWSEWAGAEKAAWSSPGVSSVKNDLHVSF
jgi:osmotically-inducible protein OsmY